MDVFITLLSIVYYRYRVIGLLAFFVIPYLWNDVPSCVIPNRVCERVRACMHASVRTDAGVQALLESAPIAAYFKTLCCSIAAALFRIGITPIDTLKTTMQVMMRHRTPWRCRSP